MPAGVIAVHVSVGKVGRGAGGKAYYLKLSREDARLGPGDYYLRDGATGRWFGRLAADMGLSGPVEAEAYRSLHDGVSPEGEHLSGNIRHPFRRPAFDLTHSLVKDASIIASASDEWRRRIIDEVASPAIEASLSYLELESCWSRRGRDGSEHVRGCGFVGAAFDHIAARPVGGGLIDPQLHRHCVVFNTTRGPDGRLRTLDGESLYGFARSAAALASVEESYRLEQLGFKLRRTGRSFQVVGIPDALREEDSKRSRQIREAAGEGSSPRGRDRANLETREPKGEVDVEMLLSDWRERNERHGLTPGRLARLSGHEPQRRDARAELTAATDRALGVICSQQSTFTPRDFLEQVALESQCRGLRAGEVRLHAWAELEKARAGHSSEILLMGFDHGGAERWTTRELHRLELGILRDASETRDRPSWLGRAAVEEAIRHRPTLLPEQREAVRRITLGAGAVKCVIGGAGTGKTYMLDCAREAIERGGGRVIGTSLSSRATRGLAAEAHINRSFNIRKLIHELDRGRLTLDPMTFVFMDEAATTGTKDYARIVSEVTRRGATLACIGDHRQHQAIAAPGGVFFGLSRRDKSTTELEKIIRQRREEDRQMVAAFRDGRAFEAVASLLSRARLHVGEDVPAAQEFLVNHWAGDAAPLREKIIVASTNAQVDAMNGRCQLQIRGERPEGGQGIRVRGAVAYEGDRILFRKNAPRLDVCNGDLATVLAADPERDELRIVLDHGGRVVTIPLSEYGREGISLGFALTSHMVQGASVENVYLFVHGRMTDAQSAYVMGSRHRNACFLATTRDDAGEELTRLVREMGRSRMKVMAHDATTDPGLARANEQAWCLEHLR